MKTFDHGNVRVLEIDADGPALSSERDATDVIGSIYGQGIDLVAIPAARLSPDFFRLSTRLAGGFIQKFVTYGVRLAIVGDIGALVETSEALKAFVSESNRGTAVWFAPDMAGLERRLKEGPKSA